MYAYIIVLFHGILLVSRHCKSCKPSGPGSSQPGQNICKRFSFHSRTRLAARKVLLEEESLQDWQLKQYGSYTIFRGRGVIQQSVLVYSQQHASHEQSTHYWVRHGTKHWPFNFMSEWPGHTEPISWLLWSRSIVPAQRRACHVNRIAPV